MWEADSVGRLFDFRMIPEVFGWPTRQDRPAEPASHIQDNPCAGWLANKAKTRPGAPGGLFEVWHAPGFAL